MKLLFLLLTLIISLPLFADWNNYNSIELLTNRMFIGVSLSENKPAVKSQFLLTHTSGAYGAVMFNSIVKNDYDILETYLIVGFKNNNSYVNYNIDYVHGFYSKYEDKTGFDAIELRLDKNVYGYFRVSAYTYYISTKDSNAWRAATFKISKNIYDFNIFTEYGFGINDIGTFILDDFYSMGIIYNYNKIVSLSVTGYHTNYLDKYKYDYEDRIVGGLKLKF